MLQPGVEKIYQGFGLRNGHSHQICKTHVLLGQICRVESHFSWKWPLASVGKSGESAQHGSASIGEYGESTQYGLANVGKSDESEQHGLANVGESGESAQHGSAHDKIGCFKHKYIFYMHKTV